MSDIQTSSTFTNIPASDSDYNSALTFTVANAEGERIAYGYQTPPSVGQTTGSTALRGLHTSEGYDGIIGHYGDTTSTGDIKTVTTSALLSSLYDIEGCRVYVQLRNIYGADASVTVRIETTDGTDALTLWTGLIAVGGQIEINFLNDYELYSKGRIVAVWELQGERTVPAPAAMLPAQGGSYLYSAVTEYTATHPCFITVTQGGYWCICSLAPAGTSVTVTSTVISGTAYVGQTRSVTFSGDAFGTSYAGYYGNTPNSSNAAIFYEAGTWQNRHGFISNSNVNGTIQGLYNGIVSGGYSAANLNGYAGGVWAFRAFADIANTSPGPIAAISEGGALGDFDNSTDIITVPALPAEEEGVTTTWGDLYLLTSVVARNFKNELFTSNVIEQIMRGFSNLTDAIITLNLYPLPLSAYTTRFRSNIYCGGVDLGNTTETNVITRYINYNLGSVDLNLYWDSALDLNPYTRLSIYLPGIGTRPIDADVCMGHTVGCVYQIDLLTGNAMAYITVDGSVMYQWPGNLAERISISGTDWGRTYEGILSTLSGAAQSAMVSGGSALAGVSVASAAALQAAKVNRETVGSLGGSFSRMGVMYPYVIIDRPIQQLPRNYGDFRAYPSHMTTLLNSINGYAEIEEIRLDDVVCTDGEREELERLLKSGVYF